MKTAIIAIPFAIEVEDNEEAEEVCDAIDKMVALNMEAAFERLDVSGSQREELKAMNAVIVCYVNWSKYD